MPIYDYKCETCDHTFEIRHGMHEPNPPCPNANVPDSPVKDVGSDAIVDTIKGKVCGGPTKKLISKGATFRLKGGGWADEGYK